MDYRFISGYRAGSTLLHVISENRVYVQKVERNGIKEYICYQTILASPKKKEMSIKKIVPLVFEFILMED